MIGDIIGGQRRALGARSGLRAVPQAGGQKQELHRLPGNSAQGQIAPRGVLHHPVDPRAQQIRTVPPPHIHRAGRHFQVCPLGRVLTSIISNRLTAFFKFAFSLKRSSSNDEMF